MRRARVRAGANAGFSQRGVRARDAAARGGTGEAGRRAARDARGRCPADKRRATCDAPSQDGSTALHLACALGSVDACEALLDAGASVDSRTDDGDAPLHVAAWTNSLAVADALLARGAPVDAAKLDGSTAPSVRRAGPPRDGARAPRPRRGPVAADRVGLRARWTARASSATTGSRALLELAAATPPASPTTGGAFCSLRAALTNALFAVWTYLVTH